MIEIATEFDRGDMQAPYEAISGLLDDTQTQLLSGSISYDTYIGDVFGRFSVLDTRTLSRFIPRDNLIYSLPENESFEHNVQLIELVESVRRGASVLLLDPLIALRPKRFIDFLKNDSSQNVPQIRHNFISTFQDKTYYRGIEVSSWSESIPLDHVSPTVRDALIRPEEFFKDKKEELEQARRNAEEYGNTVNLRNSLPFFSEFENRTWRHIGNQQTRYDFISISKYPQVVWHIVSGNAEKNWKRIMNSFTIRIFRFQVNSFYALPISDFLTSLKTSEEYLPVEEGDVKYEYPFKEEGIEYLVPFHLPVDFKTESRDFSPVFEDDIPISYRIPTPEDWND